MPDAGPALEPTETLLRPAPDSLAHGVWEAPAWAFYVAGAVVLVGALLYVAARLGFLRRRSSR